ncbi:MAG: class I SAM-dependent methyltransferase [Chloroflexia bacterium]
MNNQLAGAEYNKAIEGEGEYWDSFVADRLMRGEIPGSIDWRLTFTQFRHNHGWRPFCLGPNGINFRMNQLRHMLKTAVPKPGARVLDLGCGAGWLSLEMARLGGDVLALDISPTNLALARYMADTNTRNSPYLYKNFAGVGYDPSLFGSVKYEFADLNNAQLPHAEFDAVVVWDSLHHIANLEGLLEQVRGALKPNGVFVGVDHSVATVDTWAFHDIVTAQLDAVIAWITANDPEWLYKAVNSAADKLDWDLLAVDYDSTPVPGWEAFQATVCAEMLDVVRSGMRAEAVEKVKQAAASPKTGDEEESPFEDVSSERLVSTLINNFHAEHFTTLSPLIQPESHFPEYRSEDERIFQHYLASTLVRIGERAIEHGQTDGQWFMFQMTPERPKSGTLPKELERAKKRVSSTRAALYGQHLESEIERKNAAINELVEKVRQLEAELVEARKSRINLPWKKG